MNYICTVPFEILIMYVIWKCVQWKPDLWDPLMRIIWAILNFLSSGPNVWEDDKWDQPQNIMAQTILKGPRLEKNKRLKWKNNKWAELMG